MNTNNVPSLTAAADLRGKEYYVVKMTSTGVDLCDSATVPIGTLDRAQTPRENSGDSYVGRAVAVQLKFASIHYAKLGATTASIALGAALSVDAANPGMLIPNPGGGAVTVAIAVQAVTGAIGAVIEVIFVA